MFLHNSESWKRPTNCKMSSIKTTFSRSFAPNPTGRAYSDPDPLAGGQGNLLPLPQNLTQPPLTALRASDFSSLGLVSQSCLARPPNHWTKWRLWIEGIPHNETQIASCCSIEANNRTVDSPPCVTSAHCSWPQWVTAVGTRKGGGGQSTRLTTTRRSHRTTPRLRPVTELHAPPASLQSTARPSVHARSSISTESLIDWVEVLRPTDTTSGVWWRGSDALDKYV